MARDQARDWMWSEALQMLAQAERLHRQVFRPVPSAHGVAWEPPVDVLETKDAVLILAALPGVDPDQVQAVIEDGTLLISGERSLPDEVKTAVIHRLELPQGRFARRIDLPPGRYDDVSSIAANGCLVIRLSKAARGAR
jgi:HSP20 family protein